jgi:hypothetical protein
VLNRVEKKLALDDVFWAATVRAHPGRLSHLTIFHSKSGFYGTFVWMCRVLNGRKRRFRARRAVQPHRAVRLGLGHVAALPPPLAHFTPDYRYDYRCICF